MFQREGLALAKRRQIGVVMEVYRQHPTQEVDPQ